MTLFPYRLKGSAGTCRQAGSEWLIMKYFVYILRSERNNQLYIGISANPQRRLIEHNSGYTKSTKAYKPYKLIHSEECFNRSLARDKERFYKSGAGREFIENLFPCSSAGRASGC